MLITDYEDMYVILKVEVAALIKSYDLSIIDSDNAAFLVICNLLHQL